jgi:hypothetical protein
MIPIKLGFNGREIETMMSEIGLPLMLVPDDL